MSADRNDGKRLERLVEMIEGMSLPVGFSVEKRERVFNEAGQQIAELDILIVGQIGTVKHQTLFECRDRPFEGSAPASWIEQLVGRRERLKMDIVVGVSTTGFAPDAIRCSGPQNLDQLISEVTEGW